MLGAMFSRFRPGGSDPGHEGPIDRGAGGGPRSGRTRAALAAALRDMRQEDLVHVLREGPVRDLVAAGRSIRQRGRPDPTPVGVDLSSVVSTLADAGTRAAARRLPRAIDALPAFLADQIPVDIGERLPEPIARRLPAVRRARRRRAALRAVVAVLVTATVAGICAVLIRRWWLRRAEALERLDEEDDGPDENGEPMAELSGTDLLDLAPTAIEPMFEPHYGDHGRL